MKSLIVEDNSIASKISEKMLSRHGSCDAVDNGLKALDLFQQAHATNCPYDLILMDIMMPEMNGLDSVRTIREMEAGLGIAMTQRVKIIMVLALDDPRTVMKALYESDANSYLTKPIRLPQLEAELRALTLCQ